MIREPDRPVVGAPREWAFPRIEESRLGNGLRVLRCNLPGRPVVHVWLAGDRGALAEPPRLAGVGSMSARTMAEGTSRRDGEAFSGALEKLGAGFGARCGWDDFVYSASALPGRVAEALELLVEAVTEPAFPEAELERMRRQRIEGLRNERSRPQATSGRTLRSLIFAEGTRPSLPQGGDEQTIGSFVREDLSAFVDDCAARASWTVVAAGDLTRVDLDGILEGTIATLPNDMRGENGSAPAAEPAAPGPYVVVVDHPGAVQTNLSIGHAGPAYGIPDRAELQVATAALCGSFNSRLNRELRERHGYTYGISGGFERNTAGGVFRIGCAVQTDATDASVREIVRIVGETVRDGLTEREVASVREGIVRTAPVAFEGTGSVGGRIVGLAVHGLPLDDPDAHRAAVAATRAGQASASLGRYLRPDELIVVASGDASRIAEPLRALGHGELTVIQP